MPGKVFAPKAKRSAAGGLAGAGHPAYHRKAERQSKVPARRAFQCAPEALSEFSSESRPAARRQRPRYVCTKYPTPPQGRGEGFCPEQDDQCVPPTRLVSSAWAPNGRAAGVLSRTAVPGSVAAGAIRPRRRDARSSALRPRGDRRRSLRTLAIPASGGRPLPPNEPMTRECRAGTGPRKWEPVSAAAPSAAYGGVYPLFCPGVTRRAEGTVRASAPPLPPSPPFPPVLALSALSPQPPTVVADLARPVSAAGSANHRHCAAGTVGDVGGARLGAGWADRHCGRPVADRDGGGDGVVGGVDH